MDFMDSTNKIIALNLDDDTLTMVFEYFDPLELLNASECCKQWLTISHMDKQLWLKHSILIWKDVTRNKPDIDNLNLLDRIKHISLLQLKRALSRVDISRCIEKIDFQRMFLAKLLFGSKSAANSTALRTFYPEWALKIGVYKATYFHSRNDRHRIEIYASELCSIQWRFHFKHEEQEQQLSAHYAVQPFSKFNLDSTMISVVNPGQIHNWQFVTSSRDNITRVQIDQYPALVCSRLPDGAWRMDNHYVWFEQVGSLDSDELPLF